MLNRLQEVFASFQQHQVRYVVIESLRLACAEWSGCDYLMTCDDRLNRQGERLHQAGILVLQVLNPLDLLRET
jgi:hypothetical protein